MKTINYLVLAVLLTMQGCSDEMEERREVALELLDNECETIIDATTSFIDSELITDILAALASNRCDCINEKLAPRFAEKYPLEKLKEFKEKQIKLQFEITELVKDNHEAVKDCFKLF